MVRKEHNLETILQKRTKCGNILMLVSKLARFDHAQFLVILVLDNTLCTDLSGFRLSACGNIIFPN